MNTKIYNDDVEWLKNERKKFENYFIEHAKKEILGYDEDADKATTAPWCRPWMWTENYNIREPEKYFDWLRSGLEEVIDEDFYYNTDVDNYFEEDF